MQAINLTSPNLQFIFIYPDVILDSDIFLYIYFWNLEDTNL